MASKSPFPQHPLPVPAGLLPNQPGMKKYTATQQEFSETVVPPTRRVDYDSVFKQWKEASGGDQPCSSSGTSQRRMEKVPPTLLMNVPNRQDYDPLVVSLGPYHHNNPKLQLAEEFKQIAVELYIAHRHNNPNLQLAEEFKQIAVELYIAHRDKKSDSYDRIKTYLKCRIQAVIGDATRWYVKGSTYAYSEKDKPAKELEYDDDEYAEMMLRDGCFIVNYIGWALKPSIRKATYLDTVVATYHEYLGASAFATIVRDMFLLENQVPYQVLQVLIDHQYGKDNEKQIIESFFDFVDHRKINSKNQVPHQVLQVLIDHQYGKDDEKQIIESSFDFVDHGRTISKPKKVALKTPLHLLEAYRTYFLTRPSIQKGSIKHMAWDVSRERIMVGENARTNTPKLAWDTACLDTDCDLDDIEAVNSARYTHSIRSVKDLMAKGIHFKKSKSEYMTDITVGPSCFGFRAWLEIPPLFVGSGTKTMFQNLVAYEMCPHNPNDFGIASYISFMKSLIENGDDVKELRLNHILLNKLGSNDEVAKMFHDIIVPTVNNQFLKEVTGNIKRHYNSKAKTWTAEFVSKYLNKPWSLVALLAATLLLIFTFMQTYFAIPK